jgi:hypothetical protein
LFSKGSEVNHLVIIRFYSRIKCEMIDSRIKDQFKLALFLES